MERATRFVMYATNTPEEARDLATKFAADGEPVVVAAGGDGTLNAVVQRKPKLVLTAQGKLTYFLGKFLPSFINKQVVKVFDRENKSK